MLRAFTKAISSRCSNRKHSLFNFSEHKLLRLCNGGLCHLERTYNPSYDKQQKKLNENQGAERALVFILFRFSFIVQLELELFGLFSAIARILLLFSRTTSMLSL